MTVRPRHLPLRTCVGCRSTAPREDLLRVVAVQDQGGLRLDPDPSRVLPGRGASLHHNLSCLELAERRRAFVRALRLPAPPDPTVLREHLTSQTASAPPAPPESRSTPRCAPPPDDAVPLVDVPAMSTIQPVISQQ